MLAEDALAIRLALDELHGGVAADQMLGGIAEATDAGEQIQKAQRHR
jgi:hypothetical protein